MHFPNSSFSAMEGNCRSSLCISQVLTLRNRNASETSSPNLYQRPHAKLENLQYKVKLNPCVYSKCNYCFSSVEI